MKKKLVLLLILFFIPIFVHAEDTFERNYWAETFEDIKVVKNTNYYYSTDVTYENGLYHLSGEVQMTSVTMMGIYFEVFPQDYYYTCESATETSCEKVVAVYKRILCSRALSGDGYLGVKLHDNQRMEDKEKIYVGTDYSYENGIYTLIDYVEHDVTDISISIVLDIVYEGYYFCTDTFGTTCKHLIHLYPTNNYTTAGEDADQWQIIGDGYQYIDGHFKLINPRKMHPASTTESYGYTCISKEDTCDEVYYVEISEEYSSREGGRIHSYTKVNLPSDREMDHVNLITGDEYQLDTFFSEEELEEVFITDESIIEIENSKIVAKKVGETSLIYETNGVYKELIITITDQPVKPIENPKTSYKLYLVIGVLFINLLGLILFHKKEQKQD